MIHIFLCVYAECRCARFLPGHILDLAYQYIKKLAVWWFILVPPKVKSITYLYLEHCVPSNFNILKKVISVYTTKYNNPNISSYMVCYLCICQSNWKCDLYWYTESGQSIIIYYMIALAMYIHALMLHTWCINKINVHHSHVKNDLYLQTL